MNTTMNIRRIGFGFVLLLILANAWKWLPSMNARLKGQDMSDSSQFHVEDFQVHGLTMEPQSKSGRDIFHLGENEADVDKKKIAAAHQRPANKVAAVVQPVVATPSPQELAEAASRTQLAQIKCIGVLFQENKKPEAYMVRGDQRYIVRPGDVIGEQFEVEKITIEAVYLKDHQTGVSGTVPVDGKEGSINK